MPSTRDLLQRFRPAATPGAASATGVPADRRDERATELAGVFAALATAAHQAHCTLTTVDGTRGFRMGDRISPHVRHWHKYASTPLPPSRRFYFRRRHMNEPEVSAATIEEFARRLRECDLETLEHHLARGDFSRWVEGTIVDHVLSTEFVGIERDVAHRHAASLEQARNRLCQAIEQRYSQA